MKGKVDIVIGEQLGDEAKSANLDSLLNQKDYAAVVRFQGGNNAGHTVTVGDQVYKLHIVPCGVITPGVLSVIGNGCVLDPKIFIEEIEDLKSRGLSLEGLSVSDSVHIVFPYHRALDYTQEARRSDEDKIGSTCRGISPCYSDKINRKGIRMQDLKYPDKLRSMLIKNLVDSGLQEQFIRDLEELNLPEDHQQFLKDSLDIDSLVNEYVKIGEDLSEYVTDTTQLLLGILREGKDILAEGAQGIMLDIDFGTYPFVTSSNMVPGSLNVGTGIPPQAIRDVYGVYKSFLTRVDTVGPFPTLDRGEEAEGVIDRGHEYGTTTGRRRRLGWFDTVAGRYARDLSGVNKLTLSKIDPLTGIKELKIAVAYKYPDGTVSEVYPSDIEKLKSAEPVYEILPGWDEDITGAKSFDELPENAQRFVKRIEELLDVPLVMVGVGPGRDQRFWV